MPTCQTAKQRNAWVTRPITPTVRPPHRWGTPRFILMEALRCAWEIPLFIRMARAQCVWETPISIQTVRRQRVLEIPFFTLMAQARCSCLKSIFERQINARGRKEEKFLIQAARSFSFLLFLEKETFKIEVVCDILRSSQKNIPPLSLFSALYHAA